MNEKYQIEIDEFTDRFGSYKNKRIVLYGIGRYTATLLEGIKGFHFVGLMDKDPSKIGQSAFGLPILDKTAAENNADMVIVNTAETYWNVIYERIQDIKIPVFYKNGEKAEKKESIKLENPFKNLSYESLCNQIEKVQVVSFDFFDTLFMRSVCNPKDIFSLMEIALKDKWDNPTPFTELRDIAKKKIKENYSLDELYEQIKAIIGISDDLAEEIKYKELEIEKRLLVPRQKILSALKRAIACGKEVYIISDMYLPESFYRDIFDRYEISVPEGHILLSNVLDKSKSDGTMWKHYAEETVKGRQTLHVGDNREADIDEPVKYGIKTYMAPSAWDMLSVSSLGKTASYICNVYDTAVMGCILKELFSNPYRLWDTDGVIQIKSNYEMGYCVFAPVILTFLLWLSKISKSDKINRLVFMSRDGYFLKEDFEYLCELTGEQIECCYLGISRQLAMTASIETKKELMEYANMPYTGSITELLEDRFGIKDVEEKVDKPLEDYIEEYLLQIEKYVSDIRRKYLGYVEKMELDDDCAVVDLGFYGNNQRYLNKLTNRNMCGYYFNANLSKQNGNTSVQKMTACFQKEDDVTGENSQVLKKQIYLESFLTAPYGMVRAVDEEGNFVCADKKKNQEYFRDKEEMNRGVKQLICDYVRLFKEFKIEPDIEFVDRFYGYCFSGALKFDDVVKNSFYNDNAMMNRLESMLFY